MPKDSTLNDVVMAVESLYDALQEVAQAVQENTSAVNRWGAEIEDRLSHIEGNTM